MGIYKVFILFLLIILSAVNIKAEDGSRLWLRYAKVTPEVANSRTIQTKLKDATTLLAKKELDFYWFGPNIELKFRRYI